MSDNGLWDEHAQWWIDGFTNGVDQEYVEQIIPLALEELAGRHIVLDVGCGDGQIARALSAQGSEVLGIDPTQLHINIARERAGGPTYEVGSATRLPVADNSQDAVIACLVFEHIDEVDAAIAEVARVLKPGGQFSFFLNHPLLQTPGSGWIDDYILDPPEQYWRIGAYLVETETVEEVEKDVFIRFIHRPLSRYINALISNGLSIERMYEPAPPQGFLDRAPEYALAHTIPRLLYLRSVKR
jgi:ubiquinone/menaquinone biosynthesis C-methylase UbiE